MNRGTRRQRANFSFSYCWPAGSKLSCRKCKVVQRTMRKSCTGPALRAESMHENALMRMRTKKGRSTKSTQDAKAAARRTHRPKARFPSIWKERKAPAGGRPRAHGHLRAAPFALKGKSLKASLACGPPFSMAAGGKSLFRRPAGPKMQDTGFTTSSTRILD